MRTPTISLVLGLTALVTVVPAGPAHAAGAFWDDDGSVHERDIEGLAATGVTKGCDPPPNSRFCDDRDLTRGEMAAFLDRILGLPETDTDAFADDELSIFEPAIDRLAAAGITNGCNPPHNSRFCPERPLSRGEMAAFLDRAYDPPASDRDAFTDDEDSIFEPAIDRIAAAGITRGCNPPDNTRYCPTDHVSRAHMASFLVRADGDVAPLDPARLHERTVTYDVRAHDDSTDRDLLPLLERRAAEGLYAEEGWNIHHRLLLTQVDSGGDFTLWLTADHDVGEQAPGCDDAYSCTVGDDLYINQENFIDRPAPWHERTAAEYQRYVVLHEVGHWLDFSETAEGDSHYNDERWCVDGAAPVMKQQSISTGGCSTNVHPLPFERDCVEEAWLPDETNQGDGDADADDQCPHTPTER